jgi:MFS transporter, DHA2 family, multidrug resistance protein
MLQKRVSAIMLSGIGFFLFYVCTIMLSDMSVESGKDDFFWPLIIRGVGLGLIFIPLTTISLMNLKGKDIPQGTGLTNMVRQLGGSFGVALMATFIEQRTAFHRNVLSVNITQYSSIATQRLNGMASSFMARGMDAISAQHKALGVLDLVLYKQAALLSYLDSFFLVGFFFLLCMPLLFLFRSSKPAAAPVHIDMVAE